MKGIRKNVIYGDVSFNIKKYNKIIYFQFGIVYKQVYLKHNVKLTKINYIGEKI